MNYPIVTSNRIELDFSAHYTLYSRKFNQVMEGVHEGSRLEYSWPVYFLPYLALCGQSHISNYYGIKSLYEAAVFVRDKTLGNCLVSVAQECLKQLENNVDIKKLMGSVEDAMKLLSCATLFSYASVNTPYFYMFNQLKDVCTKRLGKRCEHTESFCKLSLLSYHQSASDQHINRLINISGLHDEGVALLPVIKDCYGDIYMMFILSPKESRQMSKPGSGVHAIDMEALHAGKR